jgi:hypothetical protein
MDQRKNNTHKRTHVAAEARKSRGSGKAWIEGRKMFDSYEDIDTHIWTGVDAEEEAGVDGRGHGLGGGQLPLTVSALETLVVVRTPLWDDQHV